jgi:hypothetical protein
MRADRSREYKIEEKYEWQGNLFQPHHRLQRYGAFGQPPKLVLQSFYRRLMQGLGRLIVVAKYALSNLNLNTNVRRPAFAFRMSIPWWKIGLVALAVFIVLKKDIQLSLNLQSPLGAAPKDEERQEPMEEAAAFDVAQSVAWGGGAAGEPDPQLVRDYIDRFADLAVSEMQKFGVPASIKMGQAILASRAGTDPEVRRANNHFGRSLAGVKYDNAWHNWREHSLLLYHEYPSLFELGDDYRQWARQLRKLQYAGDRNYDNRLNDVIETYKLYRLDEYR